MAIKYGTASAAGTDVTTPLASSGGVNVSIDTAVGTLTSATTGQQNPVENEKFNVWIYSTGANVGTSTGQFVTGAGGTGSRVFRYSISGLTNTGATFCRAIVGSPVTGGGTNVSLDTMSKYCYPIKPSTKYKVTYRINVTAFTIVGTSAGIQPVVDEYSSAGVRTVQSSGFGALRTTPTNGFIYETFYFTSGASSAFLNFMIYMISGNGSVDLDYNIFSIDEIAEPVGNALTSTSPSLVSFTAVGSTANIDQSQLTATANYPLGDLSAIYFGQQFLPSKSKLTGVIIQKHTTTGTYTGDITVAIVNNNAGVPGSTILASSTISNATWTALTVGVDYTVNLPCNLTVDGSTTYWIRLFSSTSSATDYARIKAVNPTGYPNGGIAYGTDGVTYPTTSSNDLYFKTLYYKPTTNFKASQNNQSVSISADEDGFLEASKIDLTTGRYTFDIRDVTSTIGTAFGYIFYSRVIGSGAEEFIYNTSSQYQIRTAGATNNGVLKIKIPGGITNPQIKAYLRRALISYSTDNVSYTTMYDNTGSSTAYDMTYNIPGTITTLYIKIVSNSGFGGVCFFADNTHPFSIVGTVDVSSYSILRNYPTNKDIYSQYSTSLGSPTTSATYRATKWGFPAIEYLPLGVDSTGLIARYDFLGNANDTSGNGYNGTVNGATLTTNKYGDTNSAYSFNGTSSNIVLSTVGSINTGTFAFWVYLAAGADTAYTRIFSSETSAGNGKALSWRPSQSRLSMKWAGGLVENSWILSDGWYHVAVSYDGTNDRKYLNGALAYTSGGTVTDYGNSTIKLGVAQYIANSYFAGKIQDLRIFNRVLSNAEVLALYNSAQSQQFLDVDTTATGSTVAFSETGASYTTVADGASLTISSTSTPNLFVKANITANRLYLSSNNYNSASDKKGSLKQSVTYQVKHLTGPTLKYNIGRASNLISYGN